MGRYSTGVTTTGQALRIELSYLLKNGFIQQSKFIQAQLTWTNDNSIGFESCLIENESYIGLKYTNTNRYTNEVTEHDYKIELVTVPSNLGKGEVLYFVCPVTGNRCRVLYKCYGSLIWKSREAYQNRIYYESQLEPKSMRPYKYLFVDNKLEQLYRKAKKSHYKGVPTKTWQKINELNRKNDEAMDFYPMFERLMCGVK